MRDSIAEGSPATADEFGTKSAPIVARDVHGYGAIILAVRIRVNGTDEDVRASG